MHNFAIAIIIVVAVLLIGYAWNSCSLNTYLPQSMQKTCIPINTLKK